MKISSSLERNNSAPKQSFKGIPRNPKYMPNLIGRIGKLAGEYISMPEQKLFLATSALLFQPFLDLHFAEEDKKKDAAIKSASKAIAGGLTGVTIRAVFLKVIDHYIGFQKRNKLNLHFFPDKAMETLQDSAALADVRMKQYKTTLGTLFAIIFMMLFSNSKIDVPLTSDIQDFIGGIAKEGKTWTKSLADVSKNRQNKINHWFDKRKNIVTNINSKIKKIVNIIKTNDDNEGRPKEANK